MTRRLVAVLVSALLLAGCGPDVPADVASAPSPAPAPATPVLSAGEVRQVLHDSWVTDGRRGFFVDGAARPGGPAFSLYETRWRLTLAGPAATGVDAEAVRRWVEPALAAGPVGGELPAIAHLEYAVATLRLVGAPVDPAAVAARLAALRHEWGYRSGPDATHADWGSTAIAVRLAGQVGATVPPEVRDRVRAAVAAPARPEQGVTSPGAAVALIEAAATVPPDPGTRAAAARLAASVASALRNAPPDPAWLSMELALRRAATALAVPVSAPDVTRCAALVGADGAVTFPDQRRPDPQATAAAVELGCPGARRPPPTAHSRAGWPTPEAVRASLAASAAGARAARHAGRSGDFAAALARQVREVWLPSVRAAGGTDTASTIDRTNLKLLARALGPALEAEVGRALPVPAPTGTSAGTSDLAIMLRMAELSLGPIGPRRTGTLRWLAPARERVGPPSAVRAAWLALAADTLDQPELRAEAVAEIARTRVAPGVHAMGAAEPGSASLTASAIGARIGGSTEDLPGAWGRAGLCAVDGCVESPAQLAVVNGWSLKALALLLVCDRGPARDAFPVAL